MSSATSSQGRTRGVAVLVASILLIIGAVVYIAFARSNSTGSDFKGAGNGVEQIVEIPEGATLSAMGPALTDKGVVRSDKAFQNAAMANSDADNIQPGFYRLQEKMSADEAVKDDQGNIVELRCSYDENTLGKNPEGRKVKGVIHWVPAAESVECEVRLYDRLFRSANPEKDEEGGSFLDNINPESLVVLKGCRAEPSLANAAPEERFQFEREGYFCADMKDSKPGAPVFNRTVTLRDSWGQ